MKFSLFKYIRNLLKMKIIFKRVKCLYFNILLIIFSINGKE